MKFKNNGLEICGKFCKYKKCTNAEILKHQQAIEEYQDKFNPVSDEGNKITRDVEDLNQQMKSLIGYCESINSKSDKTDKELDTVAQYQLELIELNKQKRKLVEKGEEFDRKHKNDIVEVRQYVLKEYGKLASMQLEGITADEYVNNSTPEDDVIIRLLATIKKMTAYGSKEKDIIKLVKKAVEDEAEQSFR